MSDGPQQCDDLHVSKSAFDKFIGSQPNHVGLKTVLGKTDSSRREVDMDARLQGLHVRPASIQSNFCCFDRVAAKMACPSPSTCGTCSEVSNPCNFVTSFSRAACRADFGSSSVFVSKVLHDSSVNANVSGSTLAWVSRSRARFPGCLTPERT